MCPECGVTYVPERALFTIFTDAELWVLVSIRTGGEIGCGFEVESRNAAQVYQCLWPGTQYALKAIVPRQQRKELLGPPSRTRAPAKHSTAMATKRSARTYLPSWATTHNQTSRGLAFRKVQGCMEHKFLRSGHGPGPGTILFVDVRGSEARLSDNAPPRLNCAFGTSPSLPMPACQPRPWKPGSNVQLGHEGGLDFPSLSLRLFCS